MESQNWQSAFLPGIFQGTYVDTRHSDPEKLLENIRNKSLSGPAQRKQLDLLNALNRMHQTARDPDPRLESRIASFELASTAAGNLVLQGGGKGHHADMAIALALAYFASENLLPGFTGEGQLENYW